jgi:hypothetical protein
MHGVAQGAQTLDVAATVYVPYFEAPSLPAAVARAVSGIRFRSR